jgi:hypothetical protein
MADKKNDNNKGGKSGDTDASLQEELSREAAEGADSIGDVSSNRTVSGSSTWETLPDDSGGQESGQSTADQSGKNKKR